MPGTDVDAVLFDLDDTLCRFVQSSETLPADSFEAIDVDPDPPPDYTIDGLGDLSPPPW